MYCPACLTFGLQTTADTQVAGTVLCSPHGVEAFAAVQDPRQGPPHRSPGRNRPPVFTPPPTPTPPAPEPSTPVRPDPARPDPVRPNS